MKPRVVTQSVGGALHADRGIVVHALGDCVPIIDREHPKPRAPLHHGELLLVGCWCERGGHARVRASDIVQGRTWTCGRRTCRGDTSNAEVVGPRLDAHGSIKVQ